MDEFLTKVWKNEEVRWEIIIIFVSACCSALCGLLTQNMILTAIYIGITAVIDIISEIESEMGGSIDWAKIVGNLFGIKNGIKYLIFVVFALLPVICGIATKEIEFGGVKDIPSVFFMNIFPNECGALIVCSLIAHISKLDERQFVSALVQSKKGLFNCILRVSFFACYLNAVSYKANDSWKYANYINSVYLFFIVSCGAVAVVSFLSRLVDDQPFLYTTKKAFPTWTLFFTALFLFSCCAAPLIAKVGKHEPFLLLFNTITTIILFGGILLLMARKTNGNSKAYPISEFAIFLVFAVSNCAYNFFRWDSSTGDIKSQVVSGVLVGGGSIIIVFYLGYLQRKNFKKMKKEKMGMDDQPHA